MNFLLPTTTEPTGAPSPLLRQTDTESQGSTKDAAGIPSCAAALKSRAPSQ